MSSSIFTAESLSWLSRVFIVQTFTVIFLLLSLVSYSLPYTDSIRPFFILMPIYYWSIYRPSLVSPLISFFLGLIVDLISGFPIGLHAIFFVVAHLTVKRQRLFMMGQPYAMFWMGFAIVCSSIYCIQWLFFSILNQEFISIRDILASNTMSILFFPIVAAILALIQKILPTTQKSY